LPHDAEAVHRQLEHIGTLFNATDVAVTTSLNANNHIMGGTTMGDRPAIFHDE
jgi:hypothetical protein